MSDSFPSNSKNIRINCDVTIINSEFNSEIVNQLISTTENRLKEISNLNLTKISVPGAYEIPFVIKKIKTYFLASTCWISNGYFIVINWFK